MLQTGSYRVGKLYVDMDMLPEAIIRYEQAAKIGEYEREALIAHGQTLFVKHGIAK